MSWAISLPRITEFESFSFTHDVVISLKTGDRIEHLRNFGMFRGMHVQGFRRFEDGLLQFKPTSLLIFAIETDNRSSIRM